MLPASPEETAKICLIMAGREVYEFGGFALDVEERRLARNGGPGIP